MLHDYHIHLESGPYTMAWVQRYWEVARKNGLTEIGFSDHAYRFLQARNLLDTTWADHSFNYDIRDYVDAITQARQEGMPVKLGIEMDYITSKESGIRDFLATVEWDYVIGSVHWIEDWGFDLPRFAHEWNERDVVDVYYTYYEILQQAIRSQLFDVIAHFDLVKIFGYRPPENVVMTAVYESTVRLMKDYDLAFEINTAGLHKPVQEMYPSWEILQLVAKYQIPLTISSDAHQPEHVARDFPLALQYARDAGIKNLVRFRKRKREYVALPA